MPAGQREFLLYRPAVIVYRFSISIPAIQLLGDGETLDLIRALENLEHLGIPEELLHRIFPADAIAAEHLNGVGGDLDHGVAAEALGDCHLW